MGLKTKILSKDKELCIRLSKLDGNGQVMAMQSVRTPMWRWPVLGHNMATFFEI